MRSAKVHSTAQAFLRRLLQWNDDEAVTPQAVLLPGHGKPSVSIEVLEPGGKGDVIDVEEMRRRFAGDDDLVREVAREFLIGLVPLRAELGEAAARGDLVLLMRVAHRLRGALLEVAARPAAELVRGIEHAPETAVESMGTLSTLLDEISRALIELDETR